MAQFKIIEETPPPYETRVLLYEESTDRLRIGSLKAIVKSIYKTDYDFEVEPTIMFLKAHSEYDPFQHFEKFEPTKWADLPV